MIPVPIVLGLTLCDLVIVEEGTKKVSLIGTFTGIKGQSFPLNAKPFAVFTVLTDGEGAATVELTVTHLETDDSVYSLPQTVSFPSRLIQVQVLFRITQCVFPAPGTYQFTLLVDGEWVTHRRIRVHSEEP